MTSRLDQRDPILGESVMRRQSTHSQHMREGDSQRLRCKLTFERSADVLDCAMEDEPSQGGPDHELPWADDAESDLLRAEDRVARCRGEGVGVRDRPEGGMGVEKQPHRETKSGSSFDRGSAKSARMVASPGRRHGPDESSDRMTVPRDHDLLSSLDGVKKAGKVGLGVLDGDWFHALILVLTKLLVKLALREAVAQQRPVAVPFEPPGGFQLHHSLNGAELAARICVDRPVLVLHLAGEGGGVAVLHLLSAAGQRRLCVRRAGEVRPCSIWTCPRRAHIAGAAPDEQRTVRRRRAARRHAEPPGRVAARLPKGQGKPPRPVAGRAWVGAVCGAATMGMTRVTHPAGDDPCGERQCGEARPALTNLGLVLEFLTHRASRPRLRGPRFGRRRWSWRTGQRKPSGLRRPGPPRRWPPPRASSPTPTPPPPRRA